MSLDNPTASPLFIWLYKTCKSHIHVCITHISIKYWPIDTITFIHVHCTTYLYTLLSTHLIIIWYHDCINISIYAISHKTIYYIHEWIINIHMHLICRYVLFLWRTRVWRASQRACVQWNACNQAKKKTAGSGPASKTESQYIPIEPPTDKSMQFRFHAIHQSIFQYDQYFTF